MLRGDQVHVIRHKVLVESRSQRQVAKEFGISRITVRKCIEEAVPIRKETAVASATGDGSPSAGNAAGGIGAVDRRQIAADGHADVRVVSREGHRVGVTIVKDAVAEWKWQRREVFALLTHRPGNRGS